MYAQFKFRLSMPRFLITYYYGTYLINSYLSIPDCKQMEHSSDRTDDLFPRGGGQYTRVAGSSSQVRE